MIARYSRPEMSKIWSDENKFSIWLEIEILACEAMAEIGLIPKESAIDIRQKAKFDVARILEIEEITKHDVIAFLTNVEEYVGENSRFIHLGLTSSDIGDTCFSLQCKQAGELIINGMERLKSILERRAKEFKYTLCIGRTHGIHAEPITFGHKFALWYEECKRNIERMHNAIEGISFGKLSGAVGTYENIDPRIEEYVCKRLGLKPSTITTQVIQRDGYANFIFVIALSATLLEKIATEIRHLQRTEVLEAEEYFSKGQKGSSAMPHKRNPISSENICGQARVLRSFVISALENNALWHERDISHSSVERIIFPDATISFDYILNRMINLLDNLIVYPENMKRNMELTQGLIHSQKILLHLAQKGVKRQEAYSLVQKSAMECWEKKIPFKQALLENVELMELITEEELEKLFSYDKVFKGVEFIFERCGL